MQFVEEKETQVAQAPADPMHIDVNNLTFGYAGREPVLRNLNMQLTNGARCLLIGANGAGKSTILRILSGRHLTKPDDAVRVLGMYTISEFKTVQAFC